MDLLDSFMDQKWYQIAAEITLLMSATAALLPDAWKYKSDGSERSWYKYGYGVVEFLAFNVFHAKSVETPPEPKPEDPA